MVNSFVKRALSWTILVGIVVLAFIKGSVYICSALAIVLLIMLYEWYKMNKGKLTPCYILGNLYITVPIAYWMGGVFPETKWGTGPNGFIFILAIVVLTDTLAYLGGSLIGGLKIAPNISPSKTWSGAICGLAGSIILACIYLGYSMKNITLVGIISVAGIIGDLLESKVKRHLGIKDSGNIIPGHGGFLDRLDGFLMASYVYAFIMYYVFYIRS